MRKIDVSARLSTIADSSHENTRGSLWRVPHNELHTYEEMSSFLRADFEEGKLYWLPREPSMFCPGAHSAEHQCSGWNTRHAGKEAFSYIDVRGYSRGHLQGRMYFGHRIIWMLYHRSWPDEDIDHINGITFDNRIVNLRAVTHAVNGRNQRVASNNKSGVRGVQWYAQSRKWMVRITVNKQEHFLGYYENFDEAVAVRKTAESRLGFHENHGAST